MSDLDSSIASINQRFMEAFLRGDAAGMAALYTSDGQLLPPNAPVMSGPVEIEAYWQAAMNLGIQEATISSEEIESHGDRIIEIGQFALKGNGVVLDSGKYVVIWKQEAGEWKLHRDIWNSSQTAP